MIELSQHIDFVNQYFRVADELFVDDFDHSIRVGRLFEFGSEYGTVSSFADGLNVRMNTFW